MSNSNSNINEASAAQDHFENYKKGTQVPTPPKAKFKFYPNDIWYNLNLEFP
ncbi:unnamed protein product, partial [Rotaria socialis]